MGFFDSFNESTRSGNHMSPFGEAGLLFDPLAYIGGDKYKNFMRKTWEKPNEALSPYAKKFHEFERKNPWLNPIQAEIDKTEAGGKIKGMSENKPGDAALAIMGAAFGGGALLGGGGGGLSGGGAGGGSAGGGMFGGSSGGTGVGSELGFFSNGGQAGLGGLGGGNSGLLAANNGIAGGAGMGSATAGQGMFGSMQGQAPQSWQDWMKMGQQMPQGQQQQQQQDNGPKPYLYRGQIIWM